MVLGGGGGVGEAAHDLGSISEPQKGFAARSFSLHEAEDACREMTSKGSEVFLFG